MAIKRPCNHPGCPELISGKESRCPKHKKQYNREREQWRRDRDPNYRTLFDSKAWSTKRTAKLKRNPLCEWIDDGTQCNTPAKYVQQISPGTDRGALADENLRSLCPSHHSGDTRRAWPGQEGA